MKINKERLLEAFFKKSKKTRGKIILECIGCTRFFTENKHTALFTQGTMHRIAVSSHSRICRHQINHCVVDYSLIRSCLKAQDVYFP